MSLVGSYVALSKPLVGALPVFLLAWMRFGIGGLGMVTWLRKPTQEAPMSRSTKQLLFLESFFGNFLFTLCMLLGVSMTSAVSAGVIMSTIPAVVALLSWMLLKEKLSLRITVAAALGAIGIGLLSLSKSELQALVPHGSQAHFIVFSWSIERGLIGNLLIFAAVLCEAAYAVIGKKLTVSLSPKRITALINLWGFLLMTPLGLIAAWHFDFSSVAPPLWALLVFYAMAASIWTVWLWMTGLRSVAAAKAGVFTVMLPISATLVGVFVLDEKLGALQLVAFGLALTGVLLATLPTKGNPAA